MGVFIPMLAISGIIRDGMQATQNNTDAAISPALDLSTPSSAAQSILGLDPSKVDPPSKLTNFALGLLQGAGSGKIGSGLSLSLSLDQIFHGGYVDGPSFVKNDIWFRISHFTQLSGAIVTGDGTSTPGKAAVGVSVPIWDDTNWMTHQDVLAQYAKGFDKEADAIAGVRFPDQAPWWPQYLEFSSAEALLQGKNGGLTQGLTAYLSKTVPSVDVQEPGQSTKKSLRDAVQDLVSDVKDYESYFDKISSQNKVPNFGSAANDPVFKEAFGKFSTANDLYVVIRKAAVSNDAEVVAQLKNLGSYEDDFKKEAAGYFWNRLKWDAAFASGWGAADNEYGDLATTGTQFWSTLSIPLGSTPTFNFNKDKTNLPTLMGLTVYGGLLWDSRAYSSGAYKNAGSGFSAGGRLKYGSSTTNVFVEGLDKTTGLAGKTTSNF